MLIGKNLLSNVLEKLFPGFFPIMLTCLLLWWPVVSLEDSFSAAYSPIFAMLLLVFLVLFCLHPRAAISEGMHPGWKCSPRDRNWFCRVAVGFSRAFALTRTFRGYFNTETQFFRQSARSGSFSELRGVVVGTAFFDFLIAHSQQISLPSIKIGGPISFVPQLYQEIPQSSLKFCE